MAAQHETFVMLPFLFLFTLQSFNLLIDSCVTDTRASYTRRLQTSAANSWIHVDSEQRGNKVDPSLFNSQNMQRDDVKYCLCI